MNLKTFTDGVLNIYAYKPSDKADNSSDSDEDKPSTELQQQPSESTMKCDICNVSGFPLSDINRYNFYCLMKLLAAE